jgi:redox-sensitive bicupin YhaK (pirin superfamily)
MNRSIGWQHRGVREDIGDLVTRRSVPNEAIEQIDPFLLLNHHGPQDFPAGNAGLPFGPHPHRGFETVTFIVDGAILHRDSEGHESVVGSGGVQWMTAGRGVEHSEQTPQAFREKGGHLDILQLWVNLPSRLKMAEPRYVGLQKEQIPSLAADGGRVRVNLIAGEWDGHSGPIESLTDVNMMTVELARGGKIVLPAPRGRNVLLYVVRGEVTIAGQRANQFHLVEMNDDGDGIEIEASSDALLIFGHAVPLGEPVASYGPFVMNTREEIIQAIRDYELGSFRRSSIAAL